MPELVPLATGLTFPEAPRWHEGKLWLILVVAESVGQCLAAFDIAPKGTLTSRRVLAQTPCLQPDGICLDSDGNILVATMVGQKLMTF
jgi:sugar lactone lactonase YvrE